MHDTGQISKRETAAYVSMLKALAAGAFLATFVSQVSVTAGDLQSGSTVASTDAQASSGPQKVTYLRDVLPIFMGKCIRCHTEQGHTLDNWLDYKTAVGHRAEIKRRIWDSWRGHYYKQPMPTQNSPESDAITEEERKVIVNWIQSGAPYGVRPAFGNAQSKGERMERGKQLFATICAACHQPSGQGIPERFPPLARSDFLNADKSRAIQVLLKGLQGELTVNGHAFNNSMPSLPLSDEEIACALTWVYNSFGNSGQDVTPAEVTAARAEKADGFPFKQHESVKAVEQPSPYE